MARSTLSFSLSLSLSLPAPPFSPDTTHRRYFASLAKFLASDDPLLELSLLDHVDTHATKTKSVLPFLFEGEEGRSV